MNEVPSVMRIICIPPAENCSYLSPFADAEAAKEAKYSTCPPIAPLQFKLVRPLSQSDLNKVTDLIPSMYPSKLLIAYISLSSFIVIVDVQESCTQSIVQKQEVW